MTVHDEQITMEEINPEYAAFVEKFKPKKTTDDCYTPENVYNAVADWTAREYAVERAYDCAERVLGGEWLLPEDVIYQAGFVQGREIVAQAPGFYFCR